MHSLFDLSGRCVVVTGAASGIGRESAHVLAAMGAIVHATDRDLEGAQRVAQEIGGSAIALCHDVTSAADWDRVIADIAHRHGRLDVLVNNAGIMIKRGFLETTLEEFRGLQLINVESVFIGMQTALPLMLSTAEKHGACPSIINVSSIYGQVAGAAFSAYSASKGAVRAMTKAVANEFAARRIRANTLHPGPVATNLSASWPPATDAQGQVIPAEQMRAAIEQLIPMGRMGVPEDIAGAVAFLACDASRFMTGSEVTLDGGYTAV